MDGNANYDPLLNDAEAAADAEQPSTDDPNPSDELLHDLELALNLRDNSAAGWLYWVMSSTLAEPIGPDSFKIFRDIVLKEAGEPSDPIERMLIEQLALSHFSIGELRIRSCSTEIPKLAVAFADSATRLLGEFRRCTLALEEYRAKQAVRKDRLSGKEIAEKPEVVMHNGKLHPTTNGNGSTNGKKDPASSKQRTNGHGSEIPQCLLDRMTPPIPNGSKLAAATAGNGRG